MIKNEDKKTTTAQRVGILGIAIFMLGATFALYAGIVINYDSNAAKSAEKQALEQRLQEVYSKYSAESAAQAKELSAQHFDQFVSYKSRITGFNGADVNELIKTDLVEGDGAEVNDLNYTDYAAYYVGWLQDGTIFDSSFDDNVNPTELKAPLAGSTGMIQGWLEGIQGMKIGGIRELSIPSTLAYGPDGTGDIPADAPLKFIIKLIPTPETTPSGEEMLKLYEQLYGNVEE